MKQQLETIGIDVAMLDADATCYYVTPTSRFPDPRGYVGRCYGNVIKVALEKVADAAKVLR